MSTRVVDVQSLFPPDTKIIQFHGSSNKYTALLRSKCKSKDEFREVWLKEYEKISKVSMRVLLTRPKTGKTVVYKAAFRCQHNTYPGSHQKVKSPHRKHTGCPATLKVTIKASPENRIIRSSDTLRRVYPTIININHDHNHKLPDDGNLRFSNYTSSPEDLGFDVIPNMGVVDAEVEKSNFINVEELDWSKLRNSWNAFIDKWELSNSIHLYKAVKKATGFLENCKTVNSTIAALNSVGKRVNKRKVSLKKLSCRSPQVQLSYETDTAGTEFDVCDAVDELLVIDQGWIK